MSRTKGARGKAEQSQADTVLGRKLRLHGVKCAAKDCDSDAVVHLIVGWCAPHQPKGN